MFEKSLYDLIRGLRNHKGNERGYIQDSIRECRREIRTQDMDLKATALLKLTYLEMFGHDMSWASFNVLEVMSSQKYHQKRLGYLAAVQSYRPDTEVLMLAENQLKKDLSSPMAPTISLPLVAIPHVLNMSMANSLLTDLLPRLSHSNPMIRKKTIVTLYRLALIYPETLRPAWPKIKERLLDESEDASVTAAVVNVICELGWRRPQDFLPLAPRLFDLLVEGNNNWMAIKLIKLFATLTPLEPRLIKKLLPPLTTIIKTTPAMSLLYECINGIISGGILTSAAGSTEGDEVARLCVSKLRGMLSVEGDPNLRYVALLAFERIVELHPYLVSIHEDAILHCIDDPDISIRLRALDLAVGMVNANNLTSVVDRLLHQLQASPIANMANDTSHDRGAQNGIEPLADSDDEDASASIRPQKSRPKERPQLPDDYRLNVIQKILNMCSRDNYANINDFDWYIQTLILLVDHIPASSMLISTDDGGDIQSVATSLGIELRNIAVRVRSCRTEAVHAAETLLSVNREPSLIRTANAASQAVLSPAAWIVGEFSTCLVDSLACLDSLIHPEAAELPPATLYTFLQAAVKVYASTAGDRERVWSAESKTVISLLTSRMIQFFERISSHPNLETQEVAAEFLELLRLANEAVAAHQAGSSEAPLLLTQAIPSLFAGSELNPVAADAQSRVPVPEEVELDSAINEHLNELLQVTGTVANSAEDPNFYDYYYKRAMPQKAIIEPAANRLSAPDEPFSYQSSDALDPSMVARKKAERQAYLRDDPFYISGRSSSGTATPVHDLLRSNIGDELDVDSIPIMELDLGDAGDARPLNKSNASFQAKQQKPRQNVDILADENIDQGPSGTRPSTPSRMAKTSGPAAGAQRSFLQLDSSGLGSLSLDNQSSAPGKRSQLDIERRQAEEAEMAQAMKEVERLRLEMQRAHERIEARSETTVVKKKKKKKASATEGAEPHMENGDQQINAPDERSADTAVVETAGEAPKKKKKKAKKAGDAAADEEVQDPEKPRKKKKKRREATFESVANNEE